MAKIYYAVKKGWTRGIYQYESDFLRQIKNFKNPYYKICKTYEEAEEFIHNNRKDNYISTHTEPNEVKAFVDGSYNYKKNIYGSGIVMFVDNHKYTRSITGCCTEWEELKNIAGELKAAMWAIKKAISLGKTKITLYYDFVGIEKFAREKNHPNANIRKYQKVIEDSQKHIDIHFVYIKCHSGNRYNTEADKLAKLASAIPRIKEGVKNK